MLSLSFSEFRRTLERSERFAVVCLPIAAGLLIALLGASAAAESSKNVLLVIFDDLNMDIGAYGNTQVKTPHLDAFANQSVRFDHAHCNGPYCAPSRASFISGLYPSTTGIYGGERYYEIEATKNLVSEARWDGPSVAYNNCYSHAWTVCDAQYRYILDPDGNEELYDLQIDPNEWHNLAKQDSSAVIRTDLKNKLLELSRGKRPVHQ